jgi:hypothetical protein
MGAADVLTVPVVTDADTTDDGVLYYDTTENFLEVGDGDGGGETHKFLACNGTGTEVVEYDADGEPACKAATPVTFSGSGENGYVLVYSDSDDAFHDVLMSGDASIAVDGVVTVSDATLAATVTVIDDESTNDDHEVVFTTDGVTMESDGDLSYNPGVNGGTLSAPKFAGTITTAEQNSITIMTGLVQTGAVNEGTWASDIMLTGPGDTLTIPIIVDDPTISGRLSFDSSDQQLKIGEGDSETHKFMACNGDVPEIVEYDSDGEPTCKESVQTTIGTIDDGDIMVGDTNEFVDVQMGGAATMNAAGEVTLATDAVIALAMLELCNGEGVSGLEFDNVGTATCKESTPVVLSGGQTTGDMLVYGGAAFEDVPMSGEATMTSAGVVTVNVVRSMVWNAGAFVAGNANCAAPAIVEIPDGEAAPIMQYTMVCDDGGVFWIDTHMPDGWDDTGDVRVALTVERPDGNDVFASDIWYKCKGSGEVVDTGSYATGGAVDVTLTTAHYLYYAWSAAIDMEGQCDAGDHLWMKFVIDSGNHTATTANILSAKLEYVRSGGDQP